MYVANSGSTSGPLDHQLPRHLSRARQVGSDICLVEKCVYVAFILGPLVVHMSCRGNFHTPTPASFLGARIGSRAWCHPGGQGLVLVCRNNSKETPRTVSNEVKSTLYLEFCKHLFVVCHVSRRGVSLTEHCNVALLVLHRLSRICK